MLISVPGPWGASSLRDETTGMQLCMVGKGPLGGEDGHKHLREGMEAASECKGAEVGDGTLCLRDSVCSWIIEHVEPRKREVPRQERPNYKGSEGQKAFCI